MPDTTGTLDMIDHAIRDWETSDDAMRWDPDAKADVAQPPSYDEVYDYLARTLAALTRPLAAYFAACAAEFQAMAVALEPLIIAEVAHNEDAGLRPRWHKRRCAHCNPSCYTEPFPGGREYHRRLRARARRARK